MYARATAGTRLFLGVPALRALLALNLAVAAAGAMVTVNSVVYVREVLGLSAGAVALALGAYGAGSMAVALVLPRLLDRVPDRAVMLPGALSLAVVFAGLGVVTAARDGMWRLPALLLLWAAFGAASSAVLTPAGRLVRRSVAPGDRTAAFAAQFSLSHGCWLLTYPLAGWLGAVGLGRAVSALGAIALAAALLAVRLWPSARPTAGAPAAPAPADHVHADLPLGHPHLVGALRVPTGWRHSHGHLADGLHAR
ncbi:MFS transporter [Streptomyces scabiei]|uniref:MFS transporter n=1 Tax=Streptomyces scabiei TaxID=1930 RepID=UPI0029903253|nr:MFS transporter [Streptomyces scabiei]MDW8808778.1 MFS transporter [Streptomyces scabiei]